MLAFEASFVTPRHLRIVEQQPLGTLIDLLKDVAKMHQDVVRAILRFNAIIQQADQHDRHRADESADVDAKEPSKSSPCAANPGDADSGRMATELAPQGAAEPASGVAEHVEETDAPLQSPRGSLRSVELLGCDGFVL
jgi:hypothetical protein